MLNPNMIQQFMQNPMQAVMQSKFNIPQNIANDPNAIIQHLLNTGQVSQMQINNVMQMKNNPLIKQMLNSR